MAAFVANIPMNMFPGSDVVTDGAVMLVERLFACPPTRPPGRRCSRPSRRMPPAAGLDTENLQVYEEGSAAAPTTWTNAAWCIEPLGCARPGSIRGRGDGRTSAHADRGDQDVVLLHTGRHRDRSDVVPVVNVEAAERNAMGAATGTTSRSTVAGALKALPSPTVNVNESDPW